MKTVLISCVILAFLLSATGCASHNTGGAIGAINDTAYTIYKKDSAAIEVNVTDGDTTMEEMGLGHMIIPVKR